MLLAYFYILFLLCFSGPESLRQWLLGTHPTWLWPALQDGVTLLGRQSLLWNYPDRTSSYQMTG